MDCWHIGQLFIPGFPSLHEYPHEPFLAPRMKRLSRKVSLYAESAAHHLTSLHRQVDGAAPLVAEDNIEFCTSCFLEEFGHDIAGIRHTCATALGRFLCVTNVVDGLVGAVGPHIKQHG